jgi:kynurenine formamidase
MMASLPFLGGRPLFLDQKKFIKYMWSKMLTEISYLMGVSIPKWPANPSEIPYIIQSFDQGDPCNASSIYHHMHNGTHVDAPKHFSKNGRGIEDIPIEDFYYTSPFILSLKKNEGELISRDELAQFAELIRQADILCIYTGYSDLRETDPEAYTGDFPAFSGEAAQYLRNNFPKLKAIALDVISVDSSTVGPINGFPAHKAFLDSVNSDDPRTLLLYEDVNIRKLTELQSPIKAICAFPIRWENAEAAPISMVAIS